MAGDFPQQLHASANGGTVLVAIEHDAFQNYQWVCRIAILIFIQSHGRLSNFGCCYIATLVYKSCAKTDLPGKKRMLRLLSVLLAAVAILADAQTLPTDCRGLAAGTPCDDENLCTTATVCNGNGNCVGGIPVDCSYLTSSASPCLYDVCDVLQGCIIEAQSPNTPCDTDNNLCNIERCNAAGTCVNYNIQITCSTPGDVCQPSTGQCVPAPSASATRSASITSSQSPTKSPLPSASKSAVGSQTSTITPTNFAKDIFSAMPTRTPTSSKTTSPTPTASATQWFRFNFTNPNDTRHNNNTSSHHKAGSVALIVIPTLIGACILACLFLLLTIAIGVSSGSLNKLKQRVTDCFRSCPPAWWPKRSGNVKINHTALQMDDDTLFDIDDDMATLRTNAAGGTPGDIPLSAVPTISSEDDDKDE